MGFQGHVIVNQAVVRWRFYLPLRQPTSCPHDMYIGHIHCMCHIQQCNISTKLSCLFGTSFLVEHVMAEVGLIGRGTPVVGLRSWERKFTLEYRLTDRCFKDLVVGVSSELVVVVSEFFHVHCAHSPSLLNLMFSHFSTSFSRIYLLYTYDEQKTDTEHVQQEASPCTCTNRKYLIWFHHG